jgi:hypothetical protein
MLCTEVKVAIIPITDQNVVSVPAGETHPDIAYEVVHVVPTNVRSAVAMQPQQALMLIMQRKVPMSGETVMVPKKVTRKTTGKKKTDAAAS